jgi:L-ascorbate metabolism protein UlaG (beta-lactamase superfamily)
MTKITYIGHSAFYLEDGTNAVLIDPYISGNPSATSSPRDFEPNTILLTHAHNDHLGDTLEIAKRTGATIITLSELGLWLQSHGAPDVIPANHGGTVQFEGGSTKLVPAWHTSSYADGDMIVAYSVPAGHVVRFGGKTIYFAGDTCLFGDMKLIGEEGLDVAAIPIGDHFTMGPKDALRAVEFLSPGLVIPCHYNTFPPIRQDANEFKRAVESKTGSKCQVMSPGESLDLA